MASALDHLEERLLRLEEAEAFDQRSGEQLSEALAELGQRIVSIEKRVSRMERRIEGVAEQVSELGDPGVQAPPHSAGPDVSRDPL